MYGLPQSGILAYDQLVRNLSTHGYAHCTHTPGLWSQSTRHITFYLVVDDFGIKYTNKNDAIHLQPLFRSSTPSPPTGVDRSTSE
jgi:hypothetical protein